MRNTDFLKIVKDAVKDYKDEEIAIKFIDTGSYALNALISGSIFGGIPSNRITALAGAEGTGKTFLAMSAVKAFLDSNPEANVVYFDTERSVDASFFSSRNIDADRVFIVRPETLQILKTQILQILQGYQSQKKKSPMMMVLDSLGNLPTSKEVEDSTEGKEVQDMTRARQVRSIFRTITEPLGKAEVPLIITNHTYEVIGAWVPTQTISGGGGVKYAASTIVYFTKSKDRDAKDKKTVNGIIVGATADKSRFTKAYKKVELKIDFAKGLDKYYGLFDIAVSSGVIKKLPSGSYEHPEFPERKLSEQDFIREPEKFFSSNILASVEEHCGKLFKLGTNEAISDEEETDNVDEVQDNE